MNPNIPARIHARDRADHRLQSMTLGAAALGIVATGVFGYAAALTYNGNTNTVNADQPITGSSGGVANPNTGTSGRSGTNGQSGTQNQGGTNPIFGTAPQQVAPTTGRHHAVTGSS